MPPARDPDFKFKSDTEGPTDQKQQRLAHLRGSTPAPAKPGPAAPGEEAEERVRAADGEVRLADEVGGAKKLDVEAITPRPPPAPPPQETLGQTILDSLQHPVGKTLEAFKHIQTLATEGRYATPEELAPFTKAGTVVDGIVKTVIPPVGIVSNVATIVDVSQRASNGEEVTTKTLVEQLSPFNAPREGLKPEPARAPPSPASSSSSSSSSSKAVASVPTAKAPTTESFRPPTRLEDGRVGYPLSPTRPPRLPEEGAALNPRDQPGASTRADATPAAPIPTLRPSSAPPVRTPSQSPMRPVRPQSAPPPGATAPAARTAPGAQAAAGAAKRPGSPEAFPPAKRPSVPAAERQSGPAETLSSSTSRQPSAQPTGPSVAAEVARSSAVSSGAPAATMLPEGMANLIKPEQWSSPGQNFVMGRGQYETAYREAFNGLSPDERFALRNWTYVEGTSEIYVDHVNGQAVPDTHTYYGNNFALNEYLRGGTYSEDMEQANTLLHNALSKLPAPPGEVPLLRVSDVYPGYAEDFHQGDLVTNQRLFMSASSTNQYATESFQQGYASSGQTGAMAIYEIKSVTARPTLEGISTMAGHEAEWLFQPNTVFSVEKIAKFNIDSDSQKNLPVVAMTLKEVPVMETVDAKNIHSGVRVRIGQAEQRPPPLPGTESEGEEFEYDYFSSSDSD